MPTPVRFAHRSLVDAIDTTGLGAPGGMALLRNLIPDPRTADTFVCRPAVQQIQPATTGWTGKISVFMVIGTRAYGLQANGPTGTLAGKDVPFAFDLITGAFYPVSGTSFVNLPYTVVSDDGDWEPPTCDAVGPFIVFTHPLFGANQGYYYGTLDTTNPNAPVWWAGNLSTPSAPSLGFPARPSYVRQFGSRAYFAINPRLPTTGNPSVFATDVLNPRVASSIYAFTFGDNELLVALAGLPLNNQLGGILQSLIVFKGTKNLYQITGDPALGNVMLNALNVATGTMSPRSITSTPRGLSFLSPEGVRYIDYNAQVSDALGSDGKGFSTVFRNVFNPTRACFSATAAVTRASIRNGAKDGYPWEEYWYDMPRDIWTGPHDQPIRQSYAYGKTFVVSLQNALGLYQSDVVATGTSQFTELGAQMSFEARAAYWPDTMKMREIELGETTLNVGLGQTDTQPSSVTVAVFDEVGNQLDAQLLAAPVAGVWGTGNWGTGVWGAAPVPFQPRRVDWSLPIVGRRLYHSVTGLCSGGFVLGDLYTEVEVLGYLQGAG